MKLQELYHIRDLVTGTKIWSLSGATTVFHIIDEYYEPFRSIFGGRKYSFRLIIETLVMLNREYVCVSYEHIFLD